MDVIDANFNPAFEKKNIKLRSKLTDLLIWTKVI